MRTLLAFSVLACLSAPALAAAPHPSTEITADGAIVGEVVLPQTESEVLDFLADPVRTDSLVDEVVSSEARPDGRCTRVTRSVRGRWNPLRYVVRRCRTPKGWSERLIESTDFARHDADWQVSTTASGTRVQYQVRADPNLPVPRSLVRSRTRGAVERLLRRVANSLRKGAPAP